MLITFLINFPEADDSTQSSVRTFTSVDIFENNNCILYLVQQYKHSINEVTNFLSTNTLEFIYVL